MTRRGGEPSDKKRPVSVPPPADARAIGDLIGDLPDLSDLAARLRFSANEGRIWLDEMRMILLHVSGLAAMRKELIAKLGVPDASALFFRIGYASGSADAVLVRKVRPGRTPFETFIVGPQLHQLEGIVKVEPVRLHFDIEKGEYDGEFIWRNSSEAEAHLSVYGIGNEPSCWMQLGYATGYTSAFMGRTISYREIECKTMGHPQCRIVGRPEDRWGPQGVGKSPLGVGAAGPQGVAGEHGSGAIVSMAGLRELRDPPSTAVAEPSRGRDELVGISPAFMAAAHRADQVARTNTTVLLLGETGVGKERFARRLHELSPRASGPFVAVNCSAIPEPLVEAELFGVVRGAYTGATESRAGRFERAHGGTLFLDELGTLSRQTQAKLLRAIQERQIERVGGVAPTDVDVRVVAATNEDLKSEMQRGRFRADLYYRIAVFPIRVPTLRERRADIPRLIEYFVEKFSSMHGKTVPGLSSRAIDALLDYDYPGNVRELENMVERAVILAGEGRPLDVGHFFEAEEALLPRYLTLDGSGGLAPAKEDTGEPSALDDIVGRTLDASVPLGELEARLLDAAVTRAHGNLSLAAKSLGLTRPQLAYRFKKQGDER